MFRCKVAQFLFSLFPLKFCQSFLIRSHFQKCEWCLGRAASRDEAKASLIQQDDVKYLGNLWPAVKTGILEGKTKGGAKGSFYRRWAFGAAAIAAVLLAGFLFYNALLKNGTKWEQEGEAKFQINSIRVGDEPATPFVYQPKDSDMILIWAGKSM
jgi:hypothetical protein